MMQARLLQAIVWLALLASGGCELVADFDRSQIPSNRPDTGVTPPLEEDDAGSDASAEDASAQDASATDASATDASDDDAGR